MTRMLTVIYDGDCGFCQATVEVIKKLDWFQRFNFAPFQKEGVLKKHNSLTKEMCEKEIYLCEENRDKKKYYGGYDAFKIMSLYIPVTFLISWFFFLPGVVQMGRSSYKKIASNRHLISLNKKCQINK